MQPGDCDKFQKGSPAWRDCREKLFFHMVEHPEEWQFTVTEEQTKVVREAYVRYGELTKEAIPDLPAIKLIISNSNFDKPGDVNVSEAGGHGEGAHIDVKGMFQYWTSFCSDMPEILMADPNTQMLMLVWTERKIGSILTSINLPYLSWEELEYAAHLMSPPQLRKAADDLEQADKDGFRLYATDVKDKIVTWNLKKGKVIGKIQTQEVTLP